jgi:uncharacterized damage-inducible protein DinB
VVSRSGEEHTVTPLSLTLDELLAWNAEEREKWRGWLASHPDAMAAPLQPGGRFPTVGALIDHIFLVEVRHTRRLQRQDMPSATGVAAGDVSGLFAYAAGGRRALTEYLATLTPQDASSPRDVVVQSGGAFRMTPRKLLFHMALHEVRHWAQVAAAARMAGLTPPGNHDLFYSHAME